MRALESSLLAKIPGIAHGFGTAADPAAEKWRAQWDATKPDGMARKVLDTSRARAELGWAARITLNEGLEETVAWYRSCS